MKKLAFLIILFALVSCRQNSNGEWESTWVFWIFVVILFLAWIIIEGNSKQKIEAKKIIDANLDPKLFIQCGSYVGGHPKIDNQINCCIVYKKESELIISEVRNFSFTQLPFVKGTIQIKDIKDIKVVDASTIEKNVTIGRILLVGIFALAWKKKKKNELSFVIVEWMHGRFSNVTTFSFEGESSIQMANSARNRLIDEVLGEG